MAQVCTRMKELKSQFVCEQGPFLQAGGKHAYVLVLKPVLRESTSDICTCNISGDFEECQECAKWCQMPLTQNRSTGKFLCNACASNAFKFDDTEQCMGCGSLQRVADSQMVATPRVQSPLQKSTMEVSRVNDRRGAGCSPRSQSNLSPDGPPKAKDERILSGTSEMTISEVERSLKQKWFKQRKPNRRSNSAYSSDTSLQENNANVHVQPNSTRGRTDGRYSVKMSRPPSASNLKVSPPHLFEERLPLSEMRRNTVHERWWRILSVCVWFCSAHHLQEVLCQMCVDISAIFSLWNISVWQWSCLGAAKFIKKMYHHPHPGKTMYNSVSHLDTLSKLLLGHRCQDFKSAEMCNLEEDTEYILYWTSVFLQVAVYLVFCWPKITLTLPSCNTFFVFTESVIWIVVQKNQLLLHDSWGQRVERKFGF